jgi:polyisoprenoid-binding protein YceI
MSTTAPNATGVRTYTIDPAHSSVGFSVRHMMIANVRGEFSGVSGVLKYDPDGHKTSSVEVDVDVKSFTTGAADRDTHVKGADFFDSDRFPTIKFVSTSVDPLAGDAGTVTGDLTIKDVTKSIVLHVDEESPEVKDPWGNLRVAFTAHAKIKRSDFGITYNAALETGGVLIGDDVAITVDVQFVRQP